MLSMNRYLRIILRAPVYQIAEVNLALIRFGDLSLVLLNKTLHALDNIWNHFHKTVNRCAGRLADIEHAHVSILHN